MSEEYARLELKFLAKVKEENDAGYPHAHMLSNFVPRGKADFVLIGIEQTGSGKVALERKGSALDPVATKEMRETTPEEMEALSRIIADLNERFGIELGSEHRVTLGRMLDRLGEDAALEVAARVNTLENVRITFDHKVEQVIQEIVDLNFDLYKRITDAPAFGEVVKNHLFDQYLRAHSKTKEPEGRR